MSLRYTCSHHVRGGRGKFLLKSNAGLPALLYQIPGSPQYPCSRPLPPRIPPESSMSPGLNGLVRGGRKVGPIIVGIDCIRAMSNSPVKPLPLGWLLISTLLSNEPSSMKIDFTMPDSSGINDVIDGTTRLSSGARLSRVLLRFIGLPWSGVPRNGLTKVNGCAAAESSRFLTPCHFFQCDAGRPHLARSRGVVMFMACSPRFLARG